MLSIHVNPLSYFKTPVVFLVMIEIKMASNLLDQCHCIVSYEAFGPKKDVFVRNVIVATGGQAPFCHTNNEIMII